MIVAIPVILVLFQVQVGLCQDPSNVVVVANSAKDLQLGPDCLEENGTTFYSMAALSKMESNTVVMICSREIVLDEVIMVSNVSNVSIHGFNSAVIRCPDVANAGLLFDNVCNLDLTNITIENCGFMTNIDKDSKRNINTSIAIQYLIDVKLFNVHVLNGPGTGLALFNVEGNVVITESTFDGNGYNRSSGGNGVYVELSIYLARENKCSLHSVVTVYAFNRCQFTNNSANTGLDNRISGFTRFDKGGGLCAYIRGKENVSFSVIDSIISDNTALKYGGGIYSSFHGPALNSNFTIQGCTLARNKGEFGGAQYSGYLHVRTPTHTTPLKCSHIFDNNTFEGNHATFGGGLSIYSTKTAESNKEAVVSFQNCTWTKNTAQYGSALAVLPNAWNIYTEGYLPTLTFSNCTVDTNWAEERSLNRESSIIQQYSRGAGAFYCSDHTLIFYNEIQFLRNNGSALYMGACIARFHKNSVVRFERNSGYNGGAVYMLESIIYLYDNTTVTFDSNEAYDTGGAIYFNTFDLHSYDYSKTCFIDYKQDDVVHHTVADRRVQVKFRNNRAGKGNPNHGFGHSIYASSLTACYTRFRFDANRSPHAFDSVGTFSYLPENRIKEIVTSVNYSDVHNVQVDHIPAAQGKEVTIPYEDRDDLNQTVQTAYLVTIIGNNNTSIRLEEAYTHISRNKLILYGKGDDTATVRLSTTQSRQKSLVFNVKMDRCSPGFIQQPDKNNPDNIKCVCSVGTEFEYIGIRKCNVSQSKAYRSGGHWVGYDSHNNESEDTLRVGYCPFGFCSHENFLNSTANREQLSEIVCSDSRKGTLCGKCKTGLSPHYHSLRLDCKSSQYCQWGWLFYILSELVPVTILFVVIIVFNIPFTSGVLNGFIFYAQIVQLLYITADDYIPTTKPVKTLNRLHQFLYLPFNLKTFVLDELSFCLIKNASALDIIAFSYVTLIYSFFLIIFLLLLISKCNIRYYCRSIRRCGSLLCSQEGSVIHGLTAFLILCYAHCGRISILLIAYTEIHGKGGEFITKVLYYNGELEWFSIGHLPYVIPAGILLLLVGILPPMLLLLYPIHYKILSALHLQDNRAAKAIFSPIEKLRPFLDSFQGCFKDRYRFFSGLYFIYRFLILLNITLFKLREIYFLLEVQLIVMFFLHAICQPYKKASHNIIDSLLFINLALINTFTMYNYVNISSDFVSLQAIFVTSTIQNILIFLPLPVMIFYLLSKIPWVKKVHLKPKMSKKKSTLMEEDCELPARLTCDPSELEETDTSYKKF